MTPTDAGSIIALLDRKDPDHAACQAALQTLQPPLVTTWPCFTEAMYFLGKSGGYFFQQALWHWKNAGRLVLHSLSMAETARMEQLMTQFQDTPMDLADASVVALIETLGTHRVFTLDNHFLAYRTQKGQALDVVPVQNKKR